MGVKSFFAKAAGKAANVVSKGAALSPQELEKIQEQREQYLSQLPDPSDPIAQEMTERLLAANGIEIYNAYLGQIKDLYSPVDKNVEFAWQNEEEEWILDEFKSGYNIRYINITKWVTDKKENSLEKLVNVYEVLSNENCNIALVFHRTCDETEVYLAVTNTDNASNNVNVDNFIKRIEEAIKGNFPGSEWEKKVGSGILPCLNNTNPYSVATVSNIPTEKSDKFISQTIEKLLDGVIPEEIEQEYTLILLATPVRDIEARKLRLGEFHSGLTPYATWQTQYQYTTSDTTGASATVGVNVGVNAGSQTGQNASVANSTGETLSEGKAITDSESTNEAVTQSSSKTKGSSRTDTKGTSESETKSITGSIFGSLTKSHGASVGTGGLSPVSASVNAGSSATIGGSVATTKGTTSGTSESVAKSVSNSVTEGLSKTVGKTVGKSLSKNVGKAISKTATTTAGVFSSMSLGGNFGMNFARSSNVSATVGKGESITQTYENFNIKHTLEYLEKQMKRLDECTALGMWDFAAYVLSEDINVANNVAHSYLAITQGEESYMSQAAINMWRGDTNEEGPYAEEIFNYLKELRHPLFGLNPAVTELDRDFNVYPMLVTATTSLSGKELAYSLNFPQKSISGLPVIECAEFGRNVVTYDNIVDRSERIKLGNIYHMNHEETTPVWLAKQSFTSHVFITGSTGTGKSNTVYQILNEARESGVKFLVVEPAKGEYKHAFGNEKDVFVYGTNPIFTDLLKINPFSFPEQIHVLEHIDRLVEIFNVCWPMYAAMPAVLKEAVEKSYEDCGWDLASSINRYDNNLYPSFKDVCRNIKNIIDSSEYDNENKGAYKGALLTRLKSLTTGLNGMIFTSEELSGKEIFDKNVIIDLSRVGSAETKSLLMGILVLKLQEYRMANFTGVNSELIHFTVLEEAHNLLKRTSTEQSSESANLLGKSVEMISNAIAEMRTYGEGFIIADQAPGLLDMATIRNTNTKIIMRLPDQGDRELVGKAASLNEDQIVELAKLPRGVAAVYQNEWIQAVLCKVKKADTDEGLYEYHPSSEKTKKLDSKDCLYLASMLSKGESVSEDMIVHEIKPMLFDLPIEDSIKVKILKWISNPPREPRMTKLAPIMGELFPEVKEAIKDVYQETRVPGEWTAYAEHALRKIVDIDIENQVRRDIIQCLFTDYLMHDLNKCDDLKIWSREGGLR